ncbi:recombinase RecF [Gilliamella apis]|uniref:Recombinase RecF n=2 Tax=Gilliamella apis TaxID=1970738 RepID=A0A242NXI1_9GAMM|nr:recombinase RecF [Gilliamella apis]OTQ36653.1 recombinase RecF [Gilliamella apis]OTQ39092.1 recombinase RecF [Gilliamella apis]OTQ40027.1 recombinase RecF [Gilliamella apis]OTQ44592.1 recombinase RecF [Gilliamella apis]
MKIESLKIENVGGISSLSLDSFDPNLNIICGENGIGKTNILDSIASLFSSYEPISISVKSGFEQGCIKSSVDGKVISRPIKKKYTNLTYKTWECVNDENANFNLLYLKVNRVFKYRRESSINSDPDVINRTTENAEGLDNDDIKQWFVSRYLHSAHVNNLTDVQQENIKLAISCFSLLDNKVTFCKTTTQNEIIVKTPTGEIYFELLSSGFRSILFILLGIIKEIEYRFQDNNVLASDFNGIILIDEIELHLHPEWQGKVCSVLTKTFPKAQFIISTHSPHVIQTAEANEVIALSGENGHLEKRTLDIAPHGFKGWTVEEILTDVMGMRDVRTEKYREVYTKFSRALDDNDIKAATEAHNELDKLLHPTYPLRALFKMQLDGLKG